MRKNSLSAAEASEFKASETTHSFIAPDECGSEICSKCGLIRMIATVAERSGYFYNLCDSYKIGGTGMESRYRVLNCREMIMRKVLK